MAELMVIYDPELNVAAIVNIDEQCGWGPAMPGNNCQAILEQFVHGTPFDVSVLEPEDATRLFLSFLAATGAIDDGTPGTTEPLAQAPTPAIPDADAAALAEREAHNATDVPQAQPADTDMEAHPSAPDQVMRCVNCNGAGTINFGDDMPAQQCNMCKGTGKITVGAP